MGRRAAAWLAWSLVGLSGALLVGGISCSLEEVHRSKASIRRCGGRHLYPDPDAYLLGRGRHHRLPPPPQRHWLALLQHGPGSRPQRPRGGLRQVLARRRFRPEVPRRNGGVVRFVVVDPPRVPPNKLYAVAVPGRRLLSPRWWPVAWCAGLGITGFVVGLATEAGPLEDFPEIANPYGIESPVLGEREPQPPW